MIFRIVAAVKENNNNKLDLRLCNKMISRCTLRGSLLRVISRAYCAGTNQRPGSASSTAATNAPGLSSAVVIPTAEPVGPGIKPDKSGAYKSPEYFCYNDMSYYEAEVEMAKYRCPPPNANRK